MTLGGLLFGVDTGVINGAIPYMASPQQLDLTPRFLLGLAVGGASVIVPAYLAEIATASTRGRLVTQNELMITGGQLLAFTVNALLGSCFPQVGNIWRYMIAFGMIPSIMLFIGMWRVPESPRWLVMKGKQKSALEVLQRIRSSHQQSLQEIQSFDSVMKRNKDIKRAHFRDLSHPWMRNLVLIGIGLGILQQFVGINIMMYYGTSILMKVGFGHRAALIANIGNGLTSFIATAVGMQLMYTVNRRRMLLTGIIGTGSSMAMLTLAIIWLKGTIVLPYVVISMTMCFLAFFQSCVSPTTWVLLSEIFPQSLRGLGMGISTFCLWLANFMVGFTFPIMMAHWGGVGTFAFFITCNILSLFFAYSFVPETQGKTLEQIQIELRHQLQNKANDHAVFK